MSEEKETILWKDAIIIFDSSALLDLYFLPKSAREKISKEIFEQLIDRLWLPFHVQFEYLKNREKTIKKPISEKYDPIKKKIQKISSTTKDEVLKRVEEIIRETKKDDKHPHINQKHLNNFKKNIEDFLKQNESFEKDILEEIKVVEQEVLDVETNDDVLKSLESYFKVGREFSFDEILKITQEGKHRYEYKIPPGYGDYYKKEKKGIQIFGDLIIWKQILEFSKENKKPIIFITNDITKDEDWCYIDKKATELRIHSPREELIKEIKDYSSVDFWMYNLPQFLYHANMHIESSIQDEVIQNLTHLINTKNSKGNNLTVKCSNCGRTHKHNKTEFDLDFDYISSSKRSMGAEKQYQAEEVFGCKCGNDITVTFELWEYPEGVHNYDSVEVDNGELLESFNFTVDFFKDESELDSCNCHMCSGDKEGIGNVVFFDDKQDLINEYDFHHSNHKFSYVKYGHCDWCNELHIRCAKCNSVTLLSQHQKDQKIDCEGGCGLIYLLDSSGEIEYAGDDYIKLVDHRYVDCQKCGAGFIDINQTELCDECEIEYNER